MATSAASLKNGSIVRITNPTVLPFDDPLKTQVVQAVGTSPNGRQVRSLSFVGADLYIGTAQGLAVIRNAVASTCQGGCNGVAVNDGMTGLDHVGVTGDGIDRLYLSVNGRGVFRYTVSSGVTAPVAFSGIDGGTGSTVPFAFVGGHSNLLQLDRLGNLWIGDDTSDGAANFTGRIWFISSGALSSIQ